ncbi:MAG: hypothetical protein LBD84_05645 [Campylobacteraceae bacterium]|nr:hypothetical protein [Campylobacteraceae bacterium]
MTDKQNKKQFTQEKIKKRVMFYKDLTILLLVLSVFMPLFALFFFVLVYDNSAGFNKITV